MLFGVTRTFKGRAAITHVIKWRGLQAADSQALSETLCGHMLTFPADTVLIKPEELHRAEGMCKVCWRGYLKDLTKRALKEASHDVRRTSH